MVDCSRDEKSRQWVVERVGAEPKKRWLKLHADFRGFDEAHRFYDVSSAFEMKKKQHGRCRVWVYDQIRDELLGWEDTEVEPSTNSMNYLPPPYHGGPGMFGNATTKLL